MKIGYSQKDITPSVPIYLSGYEWERLATTVHDPLYAKIIVFEQEDNRSCFISLDLIAVDDLIINEVSSRLTTYGISRENLVISVTHTHSGPGGVCDSSKGLLKEVSGLFGKTNLPYISFIVNEIITGIKDSLDNMDSFEMKMAKTKISNVGTNRHQKDGETDENILVMEFNRQDGKRILAYNMACHPTVLNKENVQVSADFPGRVAEVMDEYDTVSLFNGSAGNISTRFTRAASNFEQLDVYAKEIKQAITEALETPFYEGQMLTLDMKLEKIQLQVKKMGPLEEARVQLIECEKRVEECQKQGADATTIRLMNTFCEGAKTNINLIKTLNDIKEIIFDVTIIKINDIKIVTIPGEIFSTLTNKLKDLGEVYFFGYTNGYHLYIADVLAYEKGHYEALSSPLEKGEGERLVRKIEELL